MGPYRRAISAALIASIGVILVGCDAIDNAQYYLDRLRQFSADSKLDTSLAATSIESFLPAGIAGTPFETIYHERNLRVLADGGAQAAGSSY